jgi:hypothetical protein
VNTTSSYAKSEPAARKDRVSNSIIVWLLLVGYLVLVKAVVLPLLPPLGIEAIEQNFAWDNIVIFGLLGLMGVWLSERTGFMPALDPRVSNRQRYLWPVLAGGAIGLLASVIDLFTNGTQFLADQMGVDSFNTAFPASLFVYTSGTVLIEAVFRLFIFPALLGLISYVILRKRWPEQVFWALALLLSVLEPLGQLSGQMSAKPIEDFGQFFVMLFLPMVLTNYPMGVAQAWLFRRYGFLASFTLRIGYYIIWHIVYGSLVYPILRG